MICFNSSVFPILLRPDVFLGLLTGPSPSNRVDGSRDRPRNFVEIGSRTFLFGLFPPSTGVGDQTELRYWFRSNSEHCGSESPSSHIPDLFCSYYVAVIREKNHAAYTYLILILQLFLCHRSNNAFIIFGLIFRFERPQKAHRAIVF
jgi:hypothetical protein